MKKILAIAIVALGFVIQSCSDSSGSSKVIKKANFSNDSKMTIESKKGEYFCDFQWTDGHKDWSYNLFNDEPYLNSSMINGAPWCLIPETSTQFLVSISELNDGETHYVCRNKIAHARIMNELPEEIPIYYYEDEDDRIMKCTLLNDKNDNEITIGLSNDDVKLDKTFLNDKVYHVVKRKELYSIAGHLNIKYVMPVSLTVGLVFVDFYGDVRNNVNNETNNRIMIDSLKNYMKKAGYILTIGTNNILYTNDLSEINNLYSRYNYVIGVSYDEKKGDRILIDNRNIFIIKDDYNFFSKDSKQKARMLASLLYSKLLGIENSTNNHNSLWLSSYNDKLDFSQPSKDWENGRITGIYQQELLEFASIMRNFEKKTK